MAEITIDLLRELCDNRRIIYSVHSLERLQERDIFRKDVVSAIRTGEIIEQYPDDTPYPSCLVYGSSARNKPLHVVCAYDGNSIIVITAYYPSLDKFEADLKTRKERKA